MRKKLIYLMIFTQMLSFCCKPLLNHLAFFPNRDDVNTPLPSNFEEHYINTVDDIKIHSLYIPNKESDKLAIYFHGNAGNIFHRIETLSMLNKCGVNVLGIGYRGYGKSRGKPSENGVYKDGESALKYAIDSLGFKKEKIFLFGRSLGSIVACNTGLNNSLAGIILVTPIYSAKVMAKEIGLAIISPFAGDAFNNSKKLKDIKTPILIIHGTADETVPFWMGKKLHEENSDKSTFVEIKNGNHNELEFIAPQLYWKNIKKFINEN